MPGNTLFPDAAALIALLLIFGRSALLSGSNSCNRDFRSDPWTSLLLIAILDFGFFGIIALELLPLAADQAQATAVVQAPGNELSAARVIGEVAQLLANANLIAPTAAR